MVRDRALLAAIALSVIAALSVTVASYAHAAATSSDPDSPAPLAVSAPAPVRFGPPLAGALVVLRAFEPPPTPYSSGHRDVDLAAPAGAVILAAGDGRVSFAGSVAGRGVLVITHSDGIRTEYEPVVPLVPAGATVTRGEPVARVAALADGCQQSCLRWGARDAGGYLDPLGLLAKLGPVRLLPWLRTVATRGPGSGRRHVLAVAGGPVHPAKTWSLVVSLRARVGLGIALPQALDRHVGVDLGGREAHVPE